MKINKETIITLLDTMYDNVVAGLPGHDTVYELAEDYLSKNGNNPQLAAESLIKYQIAKCAASGFVTGIGGGLVLPVAVPADLVATYYVQMRMSAAIAHMYGHDVSSDQVKTFIYLSLVGDKVKDVVKAVGMSMGRQLTRRAIKTVSKELIFKINRAIGMKLFTKYGDKGAISLVKLVPLAGGFIGAGVNTYYCVKVGEAAIDLFSQDEEVIVA
jgi:uncharacterized protein (DUF697 family)